MAIYMDQYPWQLDIMDIESHVELDQYIHNVHINNIGYINSIQQNMDQYPVNPTSVFTSSPGSFSNSERS